MFDVSIHESTSYRTDTGPMTCLHLDGASFDRVDSTGHMDLWFTPEEWARVRREFDALQAWESGDHVAGEDAALLLERAS